MRRQRFRPPDLCLLSPCGLDMVWTRWQSSRRPGRLDTWIREARPDPRNPVPTQHYTITTVALVILAGASRSSQHGERRPRQSIGWNGLFLASLIEGGKERRFTLTETTASTKPSFKIKLGGATVRRKTVLRFAVAFVLEVKSVKRATRMVFLSSKLLLT